MEERSLSKIEAVLGLTILATLLALFVGVYIYRFDQPPPTLPSDPNWTARASAVANSPVAQATYEPEWLSPHNPKLQSSPAR